MKTLLTITRADGTKTKRLMGVQYGINEGRLLREQVLDTAGVVVRETVNTYVSDTEAASAPFSPDIGGRFVRDPMIGQVRPLRSRVVTQDGATFTYLVNTFDGSARPVSTTKSSTVSP